MEDLQAECKIFF